jgi:hypothetical protein
VTERTPFVSKVAILAVVVSILCLTGCVDTIEQRCHRESSGDTICTSFRAQRLITDPQIQGREQKSSAPSIEQNAPSISSTTPTANPSIFGSAWDSCQQQGTTVTIQCLKNQGVQVSRQSWEKCRILSEHKISKQCVWNIVEPDPEPKNQPVPEQNEGRLL